MIYDLPNKQPWYQANKGDFLGSIWATRNIDFRRNYNAARVTEKPIVTTDSTSTTSTFSEAEDGTVTWGATKNGLLAGFFVDPFASTPPTLQASWEVSGTATDTLTKSITVPAGDNQVLIVIPMAGDTVSASVNALDTVTYNGSAMTLGSGGSFGCGDNVRVRYQQVTTIAPTQTTADVVVTWLGSNPNVSAQIFLFSDVSQTSPLTGAYDVDTTTGGATSLNFDSDGDPVSAVSNAQFVQLCMSSATSHTHSEYGATQIFQTNVGTMTYSSAILGITRFDNPQDLVTAFCKEQGSVNSITTTRWWAMSNTGIYQTSNARGDFDADDSGSLPTFTDNNEDGDMKNFDNAVYVAVGDTLYKRSGSSWTTISSSLPTGRKLLEVYGDRLYIASDDEVDSMNKSDVLAGSGTNYLDLGAAQNENLYISCMRANSSGLWIGTNNSEGGRAKMFFWDGETGNTLELQKTLESGMAMAMTIKDDQPYVLDNRGILMKFNGSYFEEVARFDFDFVQLYRFNNFSASNRWIHPNGMQTIDDEILMAVNTRPEDATQEAPERHPSGIYAYHPDFGIYHKYSFTAHEDSASYTDLGHPEVSEVGAIFSLLDAEENDEKDDASDLFVSYSYKSDNSTNVYAIAKSDKAGLDRLDTVKAGSITTTWIKAEKIQDTFKKLYTVIKEFTDSSEQIIVKYRTKRDTPVSSDITWVNTTSFTSTDSAWATIKTNVDNGVEYEVEGMSGDGAGYCSQIVSITENAGTYTVTIDQTIVGATTNTARVRVAQWAQVGTAFNQDSDNKQFKEFNPNVVASKIQFKIYMVGKDVELDRLLIYSSGTQDI